MPFIRVQTNKNLSDDTIKKLLPSLSQKASEWLDKPEAYVQVVLEPDVPIMFAGTTEPSAMIEVRSLGFFGHTMGEISQALCSCIQEELSIPQDRIFINFFDLARENWGWDGKTFG